LWRGERPTFALGRPIFCRRSVAAPRTSAAKGATESGRITRITNDALNRAFSAGYAFASVPGAMPQATLTPRFQRILRRLVARSGWGGRMISAPTARCKDCLGQRPRIRCDIKTIALKARFRRPRHHRRLRIAKRLQKRRQKATEGDRRRQKATEAPIPASSLSSTRRSECGDRVVETGSRSRLRAISLRSRNLDRS
jgi:hypothetical protein